MSYKNKHIVNFGLSEKDYQLLMFLFENSHCSSIAEFFRFCLHEFYSYKTNSKNENMANRLRCDFAYLQNICEVSKNEFKRFTD